MSATLTLYGYWRSSSTWRVRIALAYKGLAYRTAPVHLLRDGGEQRSAEHARRNPMQQVPVLEVGPHRTALSQSVAIVEYLDEMMPEPPLFPPNALDRARVRQLVEIVNSGIQPAQNLRLLQRLSRQHGFDKEATRAWSAGWIADGFAALETLTASTSGRYCFGDSITAADLFLVPQLYNARRFEVDLAPFPTLLRVEQAALALDAFSSTRPEAQIDAE